MKTIKIGVKGRVQGVGFRFFTKQLADLLNIKGTVKNKFDGSVEVLAQSNNEEKLDRFIERVKESPAPYGKVTGYTLEEINQESYQDFQIIN
ncbi:acylphosphatase [Granulicatella balaenopterae]|uniref:acylphosphatase n=1 Tax=Granulicatella balaenopterae TaxID=137733 RepID=A0A1H9PLN0_9LACT|nr:acylphosphatase [Granulicatella balaenopterae]SER49104.1 acylphosphatase [Granulicatella balaenopterae]